MTKQFQKAISKPLVSVVIPSYNAERYIEKAVRSIMEQTYQNLEILIANDASKDSTAKILRQLQLEDSRIKVIQHEKNKKIVYTLNELVNMANGKYIARMDADDISLPDRIEKQVDFLENHPDYSICGSNVLEIDTNDCLIGEVSFLEFAEENEFVVRFFTPVCHPTVMCRADILRSNRYDEQFVYAEDYELWCRLILEKRCKIGNLQKSLLKYRKSSTQTGATKAAEQKMLMIDIYEKYCVVPLKYMDCHEDVFLKLNRNIPKERMIDYIKYCYSLSRNVSTAAATDIVAALMSCCAKKHYYFVLLKLLASKPGINALKKKLNCTVRKIALAR